MLGRSRCLRLLGRIPSYHELLIAIGPINPVTPLCLCHNSTIDPAWDANGINIQYEQSCTILRILGEMFILFAVS